MVLARVRPFQDESHEIIKNQDTEDIIQSILRCHSQERGEYDKICDLFDEPTAYDTGHKIWTFLRENTRYKEETEDYQTVRSPGAIVATGKTWGLDCKNYSLFSGGVLDALNRQGASIPFCYRFASYDLWNRQPKHVFVVMYPGTQNEIWIDAVLSRYDYHKQPSYYKDVDMLAKVSGVRRTRSYLPARARMGQGDGDDGDDIDLGGDDDNVPDPLMTTPTTSDTGFTFSSTAVSAAAQAGSDLTTDPSAGTTAMAPNEAGNWDYNSSTDTYELVNADGTISDTTPGDNVASTSSGSWFSNLMSSIAGGSGSASGSTGSGTSGTSGSSGTSSGTGTSQTATPVTTTPNNTMLWVIGGIAAIGLIIALTSKSNK
jgi:hypothetical protein